MREAGQRHGRDSRFGAASNHHVSFAAMQEADGVNVRLDT
jgi:hypothetical protein